MTVHEELKSLEQQIDAKFKQWDVWRTAGKEWHFKGEQEGAHFSVTLPTISEAFCAALEWIPLPSVPRCPRLLSSYLFKPAKSGTKWRLNYDDRDFGIEVKTKREAEEAAERFCQRSATAFAEWQSQYSWTLTKTEGVDFRYQG